MKSLFLLCLLLSVGRLHAQPIKGTVRDASTHEPLVGATVQLLNTETGTVTDTEGNFSLEGEGTLRVSFVGYQPKTLPTQSTAMTIALVPDKTQLQAVEVLGRLDRDYTSEYTFSATKTATLTQKLPQSVGTVTKELMADRQTFQLADAVKLVSGVTPSSFYNQYAIRGISQNEEGQLINGMRTRQYYFLQPLTANIERVEVIKGPASATFSSVDPGGSINLVTKKPLAVQRREVNVSVGSFSTLRGTLDFTGPLNEQKTLLYRLIGAYQEARSYRDLVQNDALLLSPSFSYVPNDRTALHAELILSDQRGNLDRGQPIFGAEAGRTDLNSTPIRLNLGSPSDYFRSKQLLLTGSFTHQFSEHIRVNATYMKQTWTEDLEEHRTTNAFAVDTANQPVRSLAAMQFVQRRQFWNIDNLNGYVTATAVTGAATHHLLVGYDLHRWQKLKGGGQNAARGYLLTDGTVAATFDPTRVDAYQLVTRNGVTTPRPNVEYFNLTQPSYPLRRPEEYTFNVVTALPPALTTTQAVYVQEQLDWQHFTLLLSLRHEWFEDITNYQTAQPLVVRQRAWLPRVGLTYEVSSHLHAYATYLQGYQPQANTVTLLPVAAPAGSAFAPLESDLKEVGVKVDIGRIRLTSALYEINQRNLLMNANDPDQPDLLVTRGAERSRGFEVDATGYLRPRWQLMSSYSYIDARIRQDSDPALIGARKQNTPVHSGNLWTRYDLPAMAELGELGFGLGVQYSGSKVPWFTRDFVVPAYTLLDAALYYRPVRSQVQLALLANNLTNQTYWIGAQNYLRLFPGAPRSLLLSLQYQF
ncbi:iron complex outermembrane recepter protein [Catalinimonas alkaloidigena]|uniref:Iron complex outermembrane recepter protein n=1 Tax=Catalinimonas alkaloidigena TaxID=1075417 RepID=A0A1G9VD74_9BACT|nr:TonB-dependent receptor [Catalinimonas alkaloidigena]SDM70152.1 iron complex outermembrane recepter protein [Catalinimonas alkaloidigena]